MRSPFLVCLAVCALVAGAAAQQTAPVFRAGVNLVLVDVVVRDRTGAVVKGLKAEDFELLEDGSPQKIQSFAYDEIAAGASPVITASVLSNAMPARAASAAAPPIVPAPPVNDVPMSSETLAGHRLLVLLFDTSSMQPDEVQMAVDSALKWVREKMTPFDLVAVASIGSSLAVLSDFTSDKEKVSASLAAFSAVEGTASLPVDASTMATDEATAAATDPAATADDAGTQELDTFNNDVRLRALGTLADALTPIQQKKAVLYFSSGMERNGTDNQVELRKAVNAAVRANLSIYPVDSRGLQAVVPGGSARQGSRGGLGAFSGQGVAQQFTRIEAEQETLHTLAADTGGTAFTDTNDFGEAFAKVTKDISAYYMLGFSSSNPVRDGRFRSITVRIKGHAGLKIEAREGYYADRDFGHTSKGDREALLQDQLMAPLPATDVPVFVTAGWFRQSADRYYVPISLAVPGSALPVSAEKVTLDVAGFIRDERGFPVGRIRDTLTVPPVGAGALQSRQVLYQTGVTLPPGRFTAKIVVRENSNGAMGSFETPIVVPDLKKAAMKVSSVVLSTQLQPVAGRKSASPLVRDGLELVPNLRHIVTRTQTVYFYYEVYDPGLTDGAPQLRTSLVFYRGKVKVLETPVVERTRVDAPDRKASLFQFEVSGASLKPGLYTCQINIVDGVAGKFSFPRLELYVR